MQSFRFHIPTRVIYGRGKVKDFPGEVPAGVHKLMLVTDPGLAERTGGCPIVQ